MTEQRHSTEQVAKSFRQLPTTGRESQYDLLLSGDIAGQRG